MSETDAEFVVRRRAGREVMSDIVGRLRSGAAHQTLVTTGLVNQAADLIADLRAENEKLRAALHEAADELDGYYRAEYPGDHPYSKRKLADAMRDNPARIALEETV